MAPLISLAEETSKTRGKKKGLAGAGSHSPVPEDIAAVLVRFKRLQFLELLTSHGYLPLPVKSMASSLYFHEQQ